MSSCVHTVLAILDENGYFPCTLRFQDFGELGYRLFEDLGRTNVDFGDDDHNRDIESKGNSEMFFRHPDQSVVGSDHEKSVIWFRTEKSKHCSPKVALVSCQIGEADYFGLWNVSHGVRNRCGSILAYRALSDLLP